MADLINISSSYNMLEIMRKIGQNYFDTDISEQRLGMFGYTSESLANIFGAAVLDASNRQREYNVSTAKKRSTLLYESNKIFDTNVDNAIPSKMTVYLGILTSSIINKANNGGFGMVEPNSPDPNNPNYRLVIEKDSIFTISDYNFMIEHDIQIRATYNAISKSYTYSVQYLAEGDIDITSNTAYTIPKANTAYNLDDIYIQSYVQNFNNNLSILLFKVDLIQIEKYSTTYPIIQNDMISMTGITFPYSNEMSHFNIYYRKNNNSSWNYVKCIPTYLQHETYEEDVIYYEIIHDEKKLKIDVTGFEPAYNSELRIDLYTTLASEPNNIVYSGNGSDIVIDLKSLDDRHVYTGLELNCKPITPITGGKDIPDLEELRIMVIRGKQTSNSLNTNYDILNYLKSQDSTNDMVIVKKRNDIIERIYSCYMIPRLLEGDTIPTSTMDLAIPDISTDISQETAKFILEETNSINSNKKYYYRLSSNNKVTYKGTTDYYALKNLEFKDGNTIYTILDLDKILNIIKNTNNESIFENYLKNIYFTDKLTDNDDKFTITSSFKSLYSYIIYEKCRNQESEDSWDPNNLIDYKEEIFNELYIYMNKPQIYYYFNESSDNNSPYCYDMISKKYVDKNDILSLNIPTYRFKSKKDLYIKSIDSLDGMYIETHIDSTDPTSESLFRNSALSKKSDGLYIMKYSETEIPELGTAFELDEGQIYRVRSDSYIGGYYYPYMIPNNSGTLPDFFNDIRYVDSEFNQENYSGSIENPYSESYIDYKYSVRYAIHIDNLSETQNLLMILYASYEYDETSGEDILIYKKVYDNSINTYKFNINTEASSLYSNLYMIYEGNNESIGIESSDIFGITTNNNELVNYINSNIQLYSSATTNDQNYRDILYRKVKIKEKIKDSSPNELFTFFTKIDNTENYLIKDLPLFNLDNPDNIDLDYISKKFKYYLPHKDSFIIDDSTEFLYDYTFDEKILYSPFANNNGEYYYNSTTDTYMPIYTDTDIPGIISYYTEKGKATITIKSGTPFTTAKSIRDYGISSNDTNNLDPDTSFDISSSVYDIPLNNLNDHYSGSSYTEKGKEFYNNSALLAINIDEKQSDDTSMKIYTDPKYGLYWNKSGEYLENLMKVFTVPYTILYDISNNTASYFLTSMDKNIKMNMIENNNDSPLNFSIDSLSINRNSMNEISHTKNDDFINRNGTYSITANIIANGDINNAYYEYIESSSKVTLLNEGFMNKSIILKGFIYDQATNRIAGYIDFDYVSQPNSTINMFTFTGEIKINDQLTDTYFTYIKNMYPLEITNPDRDGQGFIQIGNENLERLPNTNYAIIKGNENISIKGLVRTEDKLIPISNLRIAIGCYYINRTDNDGNQIDLSKLYIDSENLPVQIGEITPIVNYLEDGQKEERLQVQTISISGDESMIYPRFGVSCKYRFKNNDDSISESIFVHEYYLCNVYDNSMNLLDLYTDMSDFSRSVVQRDNTSDDENVVFFGDVPVIQYSKCLDQDITDRISNIIDSSSDNFKGLLKRIENNFALDYKFFRTYGPCRYFRLSKSGIDNHKEVTQAYVESHTNEIYYCINNGQYTKATSTELNDSTKIKYIDTTYTPLNNLDITIEFDLLIKNNLTISDSDVIYILKKYIKERIEKLNIETSEDDNDYTIYISNIITDIENEYNDYVRSIELVSINGNDSSYRIINYDKPSFNEVDYYSETATSLEIKEYVPEYINVPIDNIIINVRRS